MFPVASVRGLQVGHSLTLQVDLINAKEMGTAEFTLPDMSNVLQK